MIHLGTYLRHFSLKFLVGFKQFPIAKLLLGGLALIVFLFAGIMGMLTNEDDFRDENQGHGEVAAKYVG